MSIATELRQLIDYHNARVYRLVGQDLIPVAMVRARSASTSTRRRTSCG